MWYPIFKKRPERVYAFKSMVETGVTRESRILPDWTWGWVLEEVLPRAEFLQQHLLVPAVTKLYSHLGLSLEKENRH